MHQDQDFADSSNPLNLAKEQLATVLSAFRQNATPREEVLMVRLERVQDLLDKVDLGSLTVPCVGQPPSSLNLDSYHGRKLKNDYNAYHVVSLCAENRRAGGNGLSKESIADTLALGLPVTTKLLSDLREMNIIERVGKKGLMSYRITDAGLTAFDSGQLFNPFNVLSRDEFKRLFSSSFQEHLAVLRKMEQMSAVTESDRWISAGPLADACGITFNNLAARCGDLKRFGVVEGRGAELEKRQYRLSPRLISWLQETPRLLADE